MSRRQEEEASKRLEMLYDEEGVVETEDLKLVRLADLLFAERMKKKLCEWRSQLLHGGNASSSDESQTVSNGSTQSTQTVFCHMRPALSLQGFTSHQLRVIRLVMLRVISGFHLCFTLSLFFLFFTYVGSGFGFAGFRKAF